MIREYAVQPQLLTDRRMCQALTQGFGISRGRLIAQFPDIWDDLVQWAMAEAKPIQKARIVEALSLLKGRMAYRSTPWQGSTLEDWLEEAEKEDALRPFTAVIANENPRRSARVLQEDDLQETNALWHVETMCTIDRNATAIAGCAKMLIAASSEVLLVDPYFQPNERRYLRPLAQLLRFCVRPGTILPLRRVEFHTSTGCGSQDHVARACRDELAPILPASVPFKIVRWQSVQDFHNRYILTNRGGLTFGHGLDDGNGTDDVGILAESVHAQRWREFQRASSRFTFVDEFVVVGRA